MKAGRREIILKQGKTFFWHSDFWNKFQAIKLTPKFNLNCKQTIWDQNHIQECDRVVIDYRWVSTDFVDIFAHDGVQHMEAFNKLFQFISGKNSESVEIPMTAPVTFR